jgi:hypothetical protein
VSCALLSQRALGVPERGLSRVQVARALFPFGEAMHAGRKKEPFHVGQQVSRKHVQAISSARPALVTQFFGRRGSREDAAALGECACACTLSNPSFLMTSFSPCPVRLLWNPRLDAAPSHHHPDSSRAGCCTTRSLSTALLPYPLALGGF